MPIFRRITDILFANLHEFIDRFEDPPAMLRQAVREMEQAVEETMRAAAQAIAHERLLERELDRQRRRAEQLRERAAAALKQDDETAARAALRERSRLNALTEGLSDQLATARQHSGSLRRQVQALRLRLAEAQQMLRLAVARSRAVDAREQLTRVTPPFSAATGAFTRFDRLYERIEVREAEQNAYAELAGDAWTDAPDETELDVELELTAIRQELADT